MWPLAVASYKMHRIFPLFYAFRGKFMLCYAATKAKLRQKSNAKGNNKCNKCVMLQQKQRNKITLYESNQSWEYWLIFQLTKLLLLMTII